ncbi:family 1 extracellular solute-binding protein [Paenibacillus algicola]|uniref:Family 1 extracellular solute-binding protein n=1 Tax=Paenibacillus algicola TaxID=2565926 RepID=A0A4P8XJK9_9BACL|nr:extracellular solute-binding protein [Paenibacillus algicola]QCT01730.1 family 1 extracellular solute-binding protein [Paenibacillus algicola]
MQSNVVKRIVPGLLALCLVVTGCGAGSSEKEAATVEPAQKVGDKYDPPITMTTARGIDASLKFKDGETIEDNVHTRWAKDKLGINLEYMWTVPSEQNGFENKIRLSLAAGKPLPDVITVPNLLLAGELMDSGKLMDITEAFDKYASPRLKEIYNKHPELWQLVTRDGKKLGLPLTSGGDVNDPVLWVRQDWLDELGLEAPSTVEDMEKVMKAFVEAKPDGHETIGLSFSMDGGIEQAMSWVFGAYGDYMPRAWNESSDGSLVYGSIQPNVKEGLALLQDWFRKGYLDKEVALMDWNKSAEAFNSGKSGMIVGQFHSPLGRFNLEKIEGAEMKPYLYPAGPGDRRAHLGSNLYANIALFNKDFKHIDAFFHYYDMLHGNVLGDKSSDFYNCYFEGYECVVTDGKADLKNVPGGTIPARFYLINQPEIPFVQNEIRKKLFDGQEPQTGYEIRTKGLGELSVEAGAHVYESREYRVENKFLSAPTKTMLSRKAQLDKIENEYFTKIIYGELSVDAFDQFVQEWKKNGGDTITAEVNEWYKSVAAK